MRLIERLMVKRKVDETLVSFVSNLGYVALLAFVIIAALNKLGIQTASFIAVLGAAGLAIGLALQGSLSNFAAGILMIIFRPFKVGDYKYPEPLVVVSELADSSVNLTTRAWSKAADV
jgi:small conductance mechanosensitive channel